MRHRMRWLLVLGMLAGACDGSDGDEGASAEGAANAGAGETSAGVGEGEQVAQPQEEEPHYAVHEWGLVDQVLGEEATEIAAGPGQPAQGGAPVEVAPGPSPVNMAPLPAVVPPDHSMRMAPRKPVLYVHLLEPTRALTFTATVTLPGGRLLEHWPAGEVSGDTVRWARVEAQAESCAGSAYPARGGEGCTGVADGYCEAAELRTYETEDGACLRVGGQSYNHLFYRGDTVGPALPLALERAGRAVEATWQPETAPVGAVLRVTRAEGAVRVRRVEFGACGEEFRIEPADSTEGVAEATAELSRLLREQGLSEPEAQAFERAWMDALFGADARVGDALLYFLPGELVAPVASLLLEPPPDELKRVMLVRVDLGS